MKRHAVAFFAALVVVLPAAPQPPEPPGPSPAQWAALRDCESGGDYTITDPSGTYRGAYQFDLTTWAGVGGTGDPAQASPEEQDRRALKLWQQRGWQPWPVCGLEAQEVGP